MRERDKKAHQLVGAVAKRDVTHPIATVVIRNHFVTEAEAEVAEADIDDSIKRKRFCVSLKNVTIDQL